MKIEQFKKAAKRLSKNEKIELNEAQEKLSTYFGFKNFSAAVKVLSKVDVASIGSAATLSTPEAIQSKFWCDLTLSEFKLLVRLIVNKNHPQEILMTEPGQWRQKGIQMFEAALQGMVATELHKNKPLNTSNLFESMHLYRIEDMFISCREIYKMEERVATRPRECRKLESYLVINLPAYRIHKLLSKNGYGDREHLGRDISEKNSKAYEQDAMAYEQHGYRIDQASSAILSSLEAVELLGGVSQLSFELKIGAVNNMSSSIESTRVGKADLMFYSREKITILDFLRFLVSEKRMPHPFEYDAFATSFKALEEIEVFGN